MKFEKGRVYHVYNQGNNRRQLFFSDRNYVFFLHKMINYVKPYGEFISYCLMPNHFHWQFKVDKLVCQLKELNPETKNPNNEIEINDSIGIVLRSYTRAINKEKGWSGSLFREETKAKTNAVEFFIKSNIQQSKRSDYHFKCFNYIHNNPVEAGLCSKAYRWKYSSAADYWVGNEESICDLRLGREIGRLG